MDLLQLRYFCTVAKLGSITKAAENFNISQPSLSKTIINLEAELGGNLFDRIGRHIALNNQGRIFYDKIQDALYMIDSAKNQVTEPTEIPYGKINLLVLAAARVTPNLIKTFLKKYPQIRINLHQWAHHHLYHSEEYDFSISATPMDYSQFDYVPLLVEDIILAVSTSHPLAKRGIIDLREAESYEFITTSLGPSIRTFTDSLCYAAGSTPRIRCECDNPDTMLYMIADSTCVALIARDTLFNYHNDQMVALSLSNSGATRTINLAWRKGKYLSKACSLFKDYCIAYFRDIFSGPDATDTKKT
jgi:DNA-binding transcriptional LysR family regulator